MPVTGHIAPRALGAVATEAPRVVPTDPTSSAKPSTAAGNRIRMSPGYRQRRPELLRSDFVAQSSRHLRDERREWIRAPASVLGLVLADDRPLRQRRTHGTQRFRRGAHHVEG